MIRVGPGPLQPKSSTPPYKHWSQSLFTTPLNKGTCKHLTVNPLPRYTRTTPRENPESLFVTLHRHPPQWSLLVSFVVFFCVVFLSPPLSPSGVPESTPHRFCQDESRTAHRTLRDPRTTKGTGFFELVPTRLFFRIYSRVSPRDSSAPEIALFSTWSQCVLDINPPGGRCFTLSSFYWATPQNLTLPPLRLGFVHFSPSVPLIFQQFAERPLLTQSFSKIFQGYTSFFQWPPPIPPPFPDAPPPSSSGFSPSVSSIWIYVSPPTANYNRNNPLPTDLLETMLHWFFPIPGIGRFPHPLNPAGLALSKFAPPGCALLLAIPLGFLISFPRGLGF